MRRVALVALLGLLLSAAPGWESEIAQAQQECGYASGFAALYNEIPEIVGVCAGLPHSQPNGDVQQAAYYGLLVWRKADNWTAFTDGTTTWILGPCGVQSRPNAGLLPFERGEPAQCGAPRPSPYSEDAVWDWYGNGHFEGVPAACGVRNWFELDPDDPSDAGCVVREMRASGAGDQAVRFLDDTQRFLGSFKDYGSIDLGLASSPWWNMGRSEFVFLNGTPSAILISDVGLGNWEMGPDYAAIVASQPGAFPWPEYALFVSSSDGANGGQVIRMEYPLRAGRPGTDIAWMPVDFIFDADGRLSETDVLPPTPYPSAPGGL